MTETTEIILHMLWNLVLTVLLETAVARLLGVRKKQDLLYIILINCITNPIFTFNMLFVMCLFYDSRGDLIGIGVVCGLLILSEIIVIRWESRFFKTHLEYSRMNPLLLSLILNASSALLGVVLFLVLRSDISDLIRSHRPSLPNNIFLV